VLFLLALAALWLVLQTFRREKFQPEFLDTKQVARTIALEDSSHAQTTNHMKPAPYTMGPISGSESPWQVNQYKSYIQ
jgi:hypothetical protein